MPDGQLIRFEDLPSKGFTYPKDIEIYVKPMTLKEEVSSTVGRFEVSRAGYYETLLKNIDIQGNFDRKNLLYGDVQLIDLVRRLYTYELEEKIFVKDFECHNCRSKFDVDFLYKDIEFTDYGEDIFNKDFVFSDGLTVTVSPITIGEFINISRKYLTNVKYVNKVPDISDFAIAYFAASVRKMTREDKQLQFESKEALCNYVFKYFSELYKNKDKKLLEELDKEITSTIVPIKLTCQSCLEDLEVYLEPSMRFHQD